MSPKQLGGQDSGHRRAGSNAAIEKAFGDELLECADHREPGNPQMLAERPGRGYAGAAWQPPFKNRLTESRIDLAVQRDARVALEVDAGDVQEGGSLAHCVIGPADLGENAFCCRPFISLPSSPGQTVLRNARRFANLRVRSRVADPGMASLQSGRAGPRAGAERLSRVAQIPSEGTCWDWANGLERRSGLSRSICGWSRTLEDAQRSVVTVLDLKERSFAQSR